MFTTFEIGLFLLMLGFAGALATWAWMRDRVAEMKPALESAKSGGGFSNALVALTGEFFLGPGLLLVLFLPVLLFLFPLAGLAALPAIVRTWPLLRGPSILFLASILLYVAGASLILHAVL